MAEQPLTASLRNPTLEALLAQGKRIVEGKEAAKRAAEEVLQASKVSNWRLFLRTARETLGEAMGNQPDDPPSDSNARPYCLMSRPFGAGYILSLWAYEPIVDANDQDGWAWVQKLHGSEEKAYYVPIRYLWNGPAGVVVVDKGVWTNDLSEAVYLCNQATASYEEAATTPKSKKGDASGGDIKPEKK